MSRWEVLGAGGILGIQGDLMDARRPDEAQPEGLRSRDTDPEVHRIQMEILRRTAPAARLRIAMEMADEARALTAAGIATRHPDYTAAQVRWALYRLVLGDDLFRAAWPAAPELAP